MPTQEFLAALDKASQRVGRPIETVLLESCLMGNLEVLSQMGGSVSTVLASQEVLNAKALPHVEMFSAALDSDMQPRSVASRMMNAISEHGTPDTMIALEPSKLGAVTESVKALKERIESKGTSDRAFRKSAKRAVRASSPFPRRNVQTDLRRKLDLRDLGEISQSLAAAEFGPDVGQAARAVSKTSAEAVIQIVRGPGYEDSSGLSVRTESVTKKPRFNFFGLR